MGKSCSGKDTIKNILVKEHNFHAITTYTTRPMRDGEIADVTYHYITKENFLNKIKEGFFAEWKKYIVNNEEWYYGTSFEDLKNAENNTVIILNPDGVRNIKNNNISATVVYLYANLNTIKTRLNARKDKNDDPIERIKRDLKDFKKAELLSDKIVYNNYNSKIEEVVDNILNYYRRATNES